MDIKFLFICNLRSAAAHSYIIYNTQLCFMQTPREVIYIKHNRSSRVQKKMIFCIFCCKIEVYGKQETNQCTFSKFYKKYYLYNNEIVFICTCVLIQTYGDLYVPQGRRLVWLQEFTNLSGGNRYFCSGRHGKNVCVVGYVDVVVCEVGISM